MTGQPLSMPHARQRCRWLLFIATSDAIAHQTAAWRLSAPLALLAASSRHYLRPPLRPPIVIIFSVHIHSFRHYAIIHHSAHHHSPLRVAICLFHYCPNGSPATILALSFIILLFEHVHATPLLSSFFSRHHAPLLLPTPAHCRSSPFLQPFMSSPLPCSRYYSHSSLIIFTSVHFTIFDLHYTLLPLFYLFIFPFHLRRP